MLIDRRLLKNIEWGLLLLVLVILIIGVMLMFSATRARGEEGQIIFTNHLMRISLALVIMLVVATIDYHLIARHTYILYLLNLGILLAVAVRGVVGLGARRWLHLGFFSIQPSELFKITIILTVACYLSRLRKTENMDTRDLVVLSLMILFPLALILNQPDLGTAGVIALICFTMVAVGGISRRTWLLLCKITAVGALIVVGSMYFKLIKLSNFLKPYQIKRIKVLFNPSLDPLGAGYHINQSKIAIGSGGMLGKGFLNGTQSHLRFLPQQHTDFIFSVLAEEWGFIGVALVLVLFLGLFIWSVQIAREAKDRLGAMIAFGVSAMIFYHMVINIGMTVGIMPVVGLPLPLVSYGGSSVVTIMLGIGLLLNVRMRRFII